MKKYLATLILFVGFSVAHAGAFQGNSSGTFNNPTGPGGMVTAGVGTSSFTWGIGSPPSSLGYTGTGFDVNENDAFTFGTLDYFNGTISAGSGANSVDLSAALNFTLPAGIVENFVFDLSLINTTNTSNPNSSADIVNFDNSIPSSFFSSGGTDFTLEFLGFGELAGGGFTIEDSFRVFENDSASVGLVGRITSAPGQPVPVPVPAPYLLIGLGLFGLYIHKKKTRQSKSSA